MTRVRDQLAELRQEPAPPTFHPRPRRELPGDVLGERRVTRAAVLGAGSWGTTFAKVLADAGCDVTLHARRRGAGQGDHRRRARTADYLPGIRLPLGGARDRGRGGGAARAPRSSSSPSRRSRCATT